jgi:hypothetical protein
VDVLVVVLGPTSELFLAYKNDVVDEYNSIQPKLETLSKMHLHEPLYAQLLVHWLQLHFQEYWMEVEVASGRASPPNFKMLCKKAIKYKQWLHPEIPPLGYLQKNMLPTAVTPTGFSEQHGLDAPAASTVKMAKHKMDKQLYACKQNESPISKLMEKGAGIWTINAS